MSDKKISQLTASTTPLAGTEVLPIVQGGVTKQVSVANLTAGRSISVDAVNAAQVNITATPALNRMTNPSGRDYLIYSANATSNGFDGYGIFDLGLGAYVLQIDPTGNLKVPVGNLVIGTSGNGIDFSATSGTGTSELFDDYEEGTWTVTDNSGAGLTFSGNTGYYTKIGRYVHAYAAFQFPTTSNSSAASITGLPFTAANDNASRATGTITYSNFSNTENLFIYGPRNSTSFLIIDYLTNTKSNANLSGKYIWVNFHYNV